MLYSLYEKWILKKNLRIPRYNYSNIGYYFITMCTQDRKCILSNIINNDNNNFLKLELLPYGIITIYSRQSL